MSSPGGIHISATAKRQRSNMRIVRGAFRADVITDTRSQPHVHHWIVQRKGSPDIIQWGQEDSFEEAESAAEAYLQSVLTQRQKS